MRSSRWRKVFADLWENRSRTLLVLASIYIGVFAVGMIATGYSVLPRGMNATYTGAIPANIEMVVDGVDESMAESIASIEGVAGAEARLEVLMQVRAIGDEVWEDVEVSILESFADQTVKQLTLLEGEFIPTEEELLILDETQMLLGVRVGDVVEIQRDDDTIRQMRISGAVDDFTMGLQSTFSQFQAYASAEARTFLRLPEQYNRLYIAVDGEHQDQASILALAGEIETKLERSGVQVFSVVTTLSGDHPYGNYIDAVIAILALLGVFTVGLSASLVINTMNALMAQQLRQIGIMKLIGANRFQIVGMYLSLVAFLGVVAFLLAVPTAALAGYGISHMVAEALNGALIEPSSFPLAPLAIFLEGLVALLVPLAAASVPVFRGASVTVQQALSSGLIKSDGRQSRLDRAVARIKTSHLVRTLALRNTFRNRSRFILTLITFALGGGMFIAVLNVQGSLERQVDRIVGYSSADIFLEMERSYPIDEIRGMLAGIPGVERTEAWRMAIGVIELGDGEEIYVTINSPPDDTQLVQPDAAEGRWVLPEDGYAMVVNEAFWNMDPDLKPGDTLQMSIHGRERTWTIVGIYHFSGFDLKSAYVSEGALASLLNENQHASSYRILTSDHSSAFREEMVGRIETVLSREGMGTEAMTSLNQIVDEPIDKLHMVTQSLLILAVLTGIVGSIGLSGTLGLNVMERTKETGILRAVGAHDRVIGELVLTEGFVLGMVSNVLGILLSFPITRVLGDVVNQAIFRTSGAFILSWKGYVIWTAIVLMLSALASITPVRSAMKLTIREVLAYE